MRQRILQVLAGLAMVSVLFLGPVGPELAARSLGQRLYATDPARSAGPMSLCGIDGGGSGA